MSSIKDLVARSGRLSEGNMKVSPAKLEEFLPWACRNFGLDVTVIKKEIQEHAKEHHHIQKRAKSKMNNISEDKEIKSIEPDLPEPEEEGDTVRMEVTYERNNVVNMLIRKTKSKIPRQLLALIATIVGFHPFLQGITITAGVDQYIVYELSKILDICNITVVCLDDNFVKEANYDILLDKINQLQVLSLARCKIGDNGVKNIAAKLHYPSPASKTLCVLNLSSNHLTDVSCKYIANALRSNRKLNLLNMASNMITDEGGLAILNVLRQFPLTFEETIAFKQRYVDYLKRRQEIIDLFMGDLGPNGRATGILKNRFKSMKGSIAPGKKGKLPYPSNLSVNVNPVYERIAEAATKSLGEFIDPMNDCSKIDGLRYCNGNNTLIYLNLAYNNLSYIFLKFLTKVANYQHSLHREPKGLLNVRLEGNPLPVTCTEMLNLEEYFNMRLSLITKKPSAVKRRP